MAVRTVAVGLRLEFASYLEAARRLIRATRDLDDAVDDLGDSSRRTGGNLDDQADATDDAANAARRATPPVRRLDDETRRLRDDAGDAADRTRRLRNDIDDAGDAADRSRAPVRRLGDDTRRLGDDTRRLGDDLDDQAEAARRAGRGLRDTDDATRRLGGAADDTSDDVRRLRDDLDDVGDAADRASRRVRDSQGRLRDERGRFIRQDGAGGGTPGGGPDDGRSDTSILRRILGAGRRGAQGFADAVVSRVPDSLGNIIRRLPLPMQTAIAAGIAGALIAGADMIAASMTAAILLGVSGAGLAFGIKRALQSPALQGVFTPLGERMRDDLDEIAGQFVDPIRRAAVEFEDTWDALSPRVRVSVGDLARIVDPLADAIQEFAFRIWPGLAAAMDASLPVWMVLADEIPDLGHSIGTFLTLISKNGPGAAKALKLILDVAEASITGVGLTVSALAGHFNFLVHLVNESAKALAKLPPGVKETVLGPLAVKIDELAKGTQEWVDSTSQVPPALEYAATAADRVTEATRGFAAALEDAIGLMMEIDDSAMAWEQGLDDLTDSVKENGRSLDITAQKGRDNAQALLSVVSAAERARQAAIEQAGGQNASAAAINQANARYQEQISYLYNFAAALGFSRAQLDALLLKYREVANAPNLVKDITVRQRTVVIGGQSQGRYNIGGFQEYRHGGVHYARKGLLNMSRRAQIFTGGPTIYGFAEQGTQGEAFVARNADRQRSLAIGSEAMSWHRASVVPWESMRGAATPAGGTTTHVVDLQVNGESLRKLIIRGATNRGQTVAAFLKVS